MRYIIDGEDTSFTDIDSVLDYCISEDYFIDGDEDTFRDNLNESEGPVHICGRTYDVAEVLYDIDSDAYYDELRSWAEGAAEQARQDGEFELNNTDPGDYCEICGYTVTVVDDDEENESEPPHINSADIESAVNAQLQKKEQEEAAELDRENDFMKVFGNLASSMQVIA